MGTMTTTKPLPPWLLDHIRANSRNARLHTCRNCGAPILTGHDDDNAALIVTTDPTPIDPLTEALALLTGLTTYDLTNTDRRLQLHRRSRWHISRKTRGVVVPQHRCGTRWPPDPAAHAPAATRSTNDDEPPF